MDELDVEVKPCSLVRDAGKRMKRQTHTHWDIFTTNESAEAHPQNMEECPHIEKKQ